MQIRTLTIHMGCYITKEQQKLDEELCESFQS